MEGQQVSKKAAPAYDDVFGGPPRFSGSLPARLHDYADIFSGAACRIPFLDLPAATDGLDGGAAAGSWRGPRFDYAEVFGNLDFGELAVSYEELFARPKWAEAGPSDGRAIEAPTISHQATKESEFSLEDTKEGHMARVEDNRDCFSSKSNHSDHDSKKSDLSYNRTSPNSKEGAISGTTHLTDPSGFGLIVDAITPVQSQKGDAPCSMVNGVRNDEKLQSKFLSNSSSNGLKVSGNEFTTDQKKSTSQSPVSDIDRANLNHHLHSSSSNSITGEDALSSNVMYASVSDISLRTQPLQVPPPSRPPPTIFDKKGHPMLKIGTNSKINLDGRSSSKPNENPEEHSSVVFSKSHACEDAVKDSPFFFDVDIDANSSAAASAAAMKEAMELARARLKSAKDSMEKKRVNFHNHKKLGHHENKKERKVDQSSTEEDNIIEMSTQKTLVKEDKQVDAIASKERNKITNVGKASPNVGETERQVVMAKHHQQMVPRNNLKSENEFGECRVNHEHYELVSNENKYIIVGDLCDQEGTRKKTIETANISNDNHDENKEATLASEFESNRSLKEDNEKSDEGENATNLKVDIVACKKKVIKEITNVVVLACLHQEDVDDLQKVHVSSGEANENLEEAQHVHDGEMSLPYTIGNNTISRRSEEALELSGCQEFRGIHDSKADRKSKASEESCECDDNLYKSELIHRSTEEKLNSETAKEAFESEDNEKDLTVADVSCEQCKSENNLNVSMIFAILNEKEMKMPVGSCVCEAEEELNAASECRDSKKPMGVEQVDCDHTENLDQMDESKVAVAQEVREELCLTQESHTLGKNESGLDVNQVADELGEDLKKLKEAGAMMYGKPEKLMKSTEAACLRYCNEIKAKTVQVEEQKSDKIQEAAQVPCLLANSGKQNICQRDHEVIENGEIREIHVKPEFSDNSNILNTVPDASGGPLFTDLDVQQEALSEKIIGTLESAQDATKNYNVGSEKTTGDFKKTEEEENERMERGKKWAEVQARKLEEEKEREREREKDRLAVERATGEAHERALAEAREREKRISVERVTAEARQRALKESRERAEKASVLAMEKSLAEKALREARLRAERAAVERATAEARERAAERALAEKAAADARELTERPNGTYRDRLSRENVTEEHFRARNKDGPSGAKLRSNGSSSNCKGYSALNNQSEGESALRCKARLERHQRTAERVAKALAEKNMRDILSQREQAERHRLAEYLDADVKRWSNGKEGNLRALLSTLQYVLGPKSGWQSISLTDVITAAAVKKAYRKATLCVHPDKLQQRGASIQQKYICEKVFDLLKEAWNKFNSEER